MGDAISHSVLPGLVIAFLLTSTRNPIVMFVGAAVAGVGTVVLVEVIKKLGRVEPGAAMGVAFSVLFALGVLLIEKAAVRHVDLDADCVLHGQLETLAWYGAPQSLSGLLQWSSLEAVPRQVTTLAAMAVLAFTFVGVFFKELRIAAFDPALATAQGINATAMHYLLMVLVAAATVASFEAVGSILVIAMLICPAATARLLTDRLVPQLAWSVVIALICGIGGYFAATSVPALFGKDAVNAAGMMAVVAGLCIVLAVVGSPRHGLIVRHVRRRRLARQIAVDDVLASLYRVEESAPASPEPRVIPNMSATDLRRVIARMGRSGLVASGDNGIELTETGRRAAQEIVRKHRLWEHYLVEEASLAPDHVHAAAEHLEHIGINLPAGPDRDPHGRPIPKTPDDRAP
jgi:manganese/zinc/iron transport system permease protein